MGFQVWFNATQAGPATMGEFNENVARTGRMFGEQTAAVAFATEQKNGETFVDAVDKRGWSNVAHFSNGKRVR